MTSRAALQAQPRQRGGRAGPRQHRGRQPGRDAAEHERLALQAGYREDDRDTDAHDRRAEVDHAQPLEGQAPAQQRHGHGAGRRDEEERRGEADELGGARAEDRRDDQTGRHEREHHEHEPGDEGEREAGLEVLAVDRLALDEGRADALGRDDDGQLLGDDRDGEVAELGRRDQPREQDHRGHQHDLGGAAHHRRPAHAVHRRLAEVGSLGRLDRLAHDSTARRGSAAPSGPRIRSRSSRRTKRRNCGSSTCGVRRTAARM